MKYRGVLSESVEKPYSGPNDSRLPANVRAMPPKKRRQWVAIFNSAYTSCIADGGSRSTCESSAFAQAYGTVNRS